MLKYLITGTEDLIASGVLLGMLFAYIGEVYGTRGRNILGVGALAGLAAAIVMSYLKNKTKLIDTGWWNLRIFIVSIAALLLFLALDLNVLRRKRRSVPKKRQKQLVWLQKLRNVRLPE